MEKRYQVFLSSTYVDLISERTEVMQALLELECMPAGMELFPAANNTQWEWIKKVIYESDYYIVIVGGRYGTVSKETGQSYTEMEYRYALEIGKPVIGFLHEDPSKLPAKFVEQSLSMQRKLHSFRELVRSKLCKFYSSPSDLGAKVSRSITQLRKQCPATGWIRADILDKLASSDEILTLIRENEELKEKLYHLGLEKPASADLLASGSDLYEIDYFFDRYALNPETNRFRKIGEDKGGLQISWDEIFTAIAPDLLENLSYWHPSNILVKLIERNVYDELQEKYPDERFRDFRISSKCNDTIMLQFRALKFININGEGKWELTPYGDNYMTSLLAVPKGAMKNE
ncbi:MAG TPA: DUF4062 domain-containing protein [Pyrinomonadaceae bacterium]|nr:DUF4062 domain-containing protein [Pyrinomonadaceae bacterium]